MLFTDTLQFPQEKLFLIQDLVFISMLTRTYREQASININGSKSNSSVSENEVVFEGDRLEPEYADVPDNGEQFLQNGSTNNIINHLTIKMPMVY
jgi:hypothetical protein